MRTLRQALLCLLITGCSDIKSAIGTRLDWLIVQYQDNGNPIRCWKLTNVVLRLGSHPDEIYWYTPSGHIVHISGNHNRIRVGQGNFKEAAQLLRVNLDLCEGGEESTTPKTLQDWKWWI